jgi:hypothetical protein
MAVSEQMSVPDFAVVGAMKAGTTSLYHYLEQHPEVYMTSREEPHFFSYPGETVAYDGPGDEWLNENAVTDRGQYRALFSQPEDRVTGDVSPLYLYTPAAPETFRELRPDVTLIAVLRNPVERAYSSFMHLRRDDREPMSTFAEALEAEEKRIEQHWAPIWHFTRASMYGRQLERYRWFLDREQMHVVLFEDFKEETEEVVTKIYDWIGVDSSFTPEMTVHNASGLPYSQLAHDFLSGRHPVKEAIKPLIPSSWRKRLAHAVKNLNLQSSPFLDETLRRQLIREVFADDLRRLESLIDRDVSHWYSES